MIVQTDDVRDKLVNQFMTGTPFFRISQSAEHSFKGDVFEIENVSLDYLDDLISHIKTWKKSNGLECNETSKPTPKEEYREYLLKQNLHMDE